MRIAIESDALARTAARYSALAQEQITASVRHLSTGLRVTSAIDDAVGLAVAERLRAQYEGMYQAGRNAQEGLNLLGIADGALTRTTELLHRIRVIAVQASNGTYTDTQRRYLQRAVDLSLDEIHAIAERTTYDGQALLDGSRTRWHLQVGPDAGQTMTIEVGAADLEALGLAEPPADETTTDPGAGDVAERRGGTDAPATLAQARADFAQVAHAGALSVRTPQAAVTSLDLLDRALAYVLAERAEFAAAGTRLERLIRTLGVSADAARSGHARITEADLPAEVATMLRAQIAAEVTAHMMAQAQRAQGLVHALLRPLDARPSNGPTPAPPAGAAAPPDRWAPAADAKAPPRTSPQHTSTAPASGSASALADSSAPTGPVRYAVASAEPARGAARAPTARPGTPGS